MAIKSFPYDSKFTGISEQGFPMGDRDATSAEWANYVSRLYTNGYYADDENSLYVTANGGMDILINPGAGMINGREVCIFDGGEILTVPAAGNKPRIDLVVLRLDLNDNVRWITPIILQGSEDISPIEPTLTRNFVVWDMVLARINVSAHAVSINQSDINDLRKNISYCGKVIPVAGETNADSFTVAEGETIKAGDVVAKTDKGIQKIFVRALAPLIEFVSGALTKGAVFKKYRSNEILYHSEDSLLTVALSDYGLNVRNECHSIGTVIKDICALTDDLVVVAYTISAQYIYVSVSSKTLGVGTRFTVSAPSGYVTDPKVKRLSDNNFYMRVYTGSGSGYKHTIYGISGNTVTTGTMALKIPPVANWDVTGFGNIAASYYIEENGSGYITTTSTTYIFANDAAYISKVLRFNSVTHDVANNCAFVSINATTGVVLYAQHNTNKLVAKIIYINGTSITGGASWISEGVVNRELSKAQVHGNKVFINYAGYTTLVLCVENDDIFPVTSIFNKVAVNLQQTYILNNTIPFNDDTFVNVYSEMSNNSINLFEHHHIYENSIIGIALENGSGGEKVKVQTSPATLSLYDSLIPGAAYYAGSNGKIITELLKPESQPRLGLAKNSTDLIFGGVSYT